MPPPTSTSSTAAASGGTPWLPIVIASLALLVSVGTFVWNLVKHLRLDGPRIIVRLDPALWVPDEGMQRQRSRDGSLRRREHDDEDSRFWTHTRGVECAVLEVENAGRSAVTLSGPGIAFRGKRGGWLRRRSRRSIVPRLFPGAASTDSEMRRDWSPVRLDPYARVAWTLDVHSILGAARNARPGSRCVVLRGKIQLGGRPKRPRLSSWRRRWRVPLRARSLVEYGRTMPAESAILLVLARHLIRDDRAFGSLEYASRLIAVGLWESRRIEDLPERIGEALGFDPEIQMILTEAGVILARFYIWELMTKEFDRLTWVGAIEQKKLHQAAIDSRHQRKERAEWSDLPVDPDAR